MRGQVTQLEGEKRTRRRWTERAEGEKREWVEPESEDVPPKEGTGTAAELSRGALEEQRERLHTICSPKLMKLSEKRSSLLPLPSAAFFLSSKHLHSQHCHPRSSTAVSQHPTSLRQSQLELDRPVAVETRAASVDDGENSASRSLSVLRGVEPPLSLSLFPPAAFPLWSASRKTASQPAFTSISTFNCGFLLFLRWCSGTSDVVPT
jgi:hypothetical protein